uniref:CCHC-type domain-containing protein n=1 Tax=Callorhinchus milii TaxID=7868 RepID=A0A4W3HH80_CALMI
MDGDRIEGFNFTNPYPRRRFCEVPGDPNQNCFSCGAYGHWSQDCPTRSQRSQIQCYPLSCPFMVTNHSLNVIF